MSCKVIIRQSVRSLLVIIVLLLLPLGSASQERPALEVYFLDVGQADAAVIISEGEVMMIDGGNKGDSSLVYSFLKNTLKVDHIHTIVLSHAHEDHIGGVAGALNACTVDRVLSPVENYDSKAFQNVVKYATQQGLSLTIPSNGAQYRLGDALITIFVSDSGGGSANEQGLIVRIDCGETSLLFPGDIGNQTEQDLIDMGCALNADILKVSHHGSDSSSSRAWLSEVEPSYAVISVGKDNRYGHPTASVLERIDEAGCSVYRTDAMGSIHLVIDGEQLHFETEKQLALAA